MGQINLYRIDDIKQSDFEDNIDCKFFRLQSMMG